jgi:hypothetical protein
MSQPIDSLAAREEPPLLHPICPRCSRLMRLSTATPGDVSDLVEIRTYACDCGHEIIQTIETH